MVFKVRDYVNEEHKEREKKGTIKETGTSG